MLQDYRDKGLADTANAMLEFLSPSLNGLTVLELGCGIGALTVEMLRKGASSVVGIDLSPKMIDLARMMAGEAGFTESATFQVGDGAVAQLKRSDIVILDSVLCCYPDVDSLVENSSSAAGRFYAISVPDDDRLATKVLRAILPLQDIIVAVAGRAGFRFYLHRTDAIKKKLEVKGFKLTSKSPQGWIWSVFVFAAPSAV